MRFRRSWRAFPFLLVPSPRLSTLAWSSYCDAFVERDNLYIVMEFAEHGDIGRQIEKFKKANKYVKEDTIWSYAIQVATGLYSLHSKSILHRDIKPKNVFLTGRNHVRLGDLGCAKLMKGGLARTQIGACGSKCVHVHVRVSVCRTSNTHAHAYVAAPASLNTRLPRATCAARPLRCRYAVLHVP